MRREITLFPRSWRQRPPARTVIKTRFLFSPYVTAFVCMCVNSTLFLSLSCLFFSMSFGATGCCCCCYYYISLYIKRTTCVISGGSENFHYTILFYSLGQHSRRLAKNIYTASVYCIYIYHVTSTSHNIQRAIVSVLYTAIHTHIHSDDSLSSFELDQW